MFYVYLLLQCKFVLNRWFRHAGNWCLQNSESSLTALSAHETCNRFKYVGSQNYAQVSRHWILPSHAELSVAGCGGGPILKMAPKSVFPENWKSSFRIRKRLRHFISDSRIKNKRVGRRASDCGVWMRLNSCGSSHLSHLDIVSECVDL